MKSILATLMILMPLLFMGQSDTTSIYKIFRDTTGGKGQVTIQQDPLIRFLIDKDISRNQRLRGIKDGYRIQIFSEFGNDARERSTKVRIDFLSQYPEFDPVRVYSKYEPPFIKVRVGDYRTRFEALEHYRYIVKEFPDCYIVKTRINYPELKK